MRRRAPQSELVFVHLSDIHFRKGKSADIHDEDEDVRNELERDLRRLIPRVGPVTAILVSGDIAFAGLETEFRLAQGWLARISELVSCEKVLVTPGNHDVRRQVADTARPMHDRILDKPSLAAQCDELSTCLRDPAQGDLLFASLDEYNRFASSYGCTVSRELPYWEKAFPFADGTVMRIRGITSTLLSSSRDDEDINTNNLLYGTAQRTLLAKSGVCRVVMGHHPPSWVLDGDLASQAFTERAVLQLFGHEHNYWMDPGAQCIRIYAGAVHPDRNGTNWVPRYNVIGVAKQQRVIAFHLFPRRWTSDHGKRFMADFDPDGNEYVSKSIRIPAD